MEVGDKDEQSKKVGERNGEEWSAGVKPREEKRQGGGGGREVGRKATPQLSLQPEVQD